MFRLIVIMSLALLIDADIDEKPTIRTVSIQYEHNGVPYPDGLQYFTCYAATENDRKSYTLTIHSEPGNFSKSIEVQPTNSPDPYEKHLESLAIALNESGTYWCTAYNEDGRSTVSVRLTDDLNIFNNEYRQLRIVFTGRDKPQISDEAAFLFWINNNRTIEDVACKKNDEPLISLDNVYYITPVSGVYNCTYNGQIYGFEIKYGNENLLSNQVSRMTASISYKPAIGDVSLEYDFDGVPYFKCSAYFWRKNYTLTIQNDHRNLRKSKSVQYELERNVSVLESIELEISETGEYTCSAYDDNGYAAVSIPFSDVLNIFNNETCNPVATPVSSTNYEPEIIKVSLEYDFDGIPHFKCSAYFWQRNYRLTILNDRGNLNKSKIVQYQSETNKFSAFESVDQAISEPGTYYCAVYDDDYGFTFVSFQFSDSLNIFKNETRHLRLHFSAEAKALRSAEFRANLYWTMMNNNTQEVISCYRNDKALELNSNQFKYTDISPVTGNYRCVDRKGHNYEFEVEIGNEENI